MMNVKGLRQLDIVNAIKDLIVVIGDLDSTENQPAMEEFRPMLVSGIGYLFAIFTEFYGEGCLAAYPESHKDIAAFIADNGGVVTPLPGPGSLKEMFVHVIAWNVAVYKASRPYYTGADVDEIGDIVSAIHTFHIYDHRLPGANDASNV